MFLLSKIKIGAVALIIIGGLLGGLYIQSLQAQRAKLTQAAEWNRQELAAMEQANEALHQNLAAHQAALAEREAHQSALSAELGNLNQELENLYGIDCEAKSWSDTGVPAGVRQRLHIGREAR